MRGWARLLGPVLAGALALTACAGPAATKDAADPAAASAPAAGGTVDLAFTVATLDGGTFDGQRQAPQVGGAAYAIASLSCTIGPFLAIVVTSFRAGSPAEGVALFLAYAAGMGLTVAAAALAVALAHGSLVSRLRRAAPLLSRLDGLLLAAGGYAAYYGWWEMRVLAGDTTTDPVIDTGAAVQRWLAATLERAGPATIAAIVAVLAAAGLAVAWATVRRGRPGVDR